MIATPRVWGGDRCVYKAVISLTSPFKLHYLTKRVYVSREDSMRYGVGNGVELDTDEGIILHHGENVGNLTRFETRLVKALEPLSLVRFEDLSDTPNAARNPHKAVQQAAKRLRKRLSDLGAGDWLESVHGRGYRRRVVSEAADPYAWAQLQNAPIVLSNLWRSLGNTPVTFVHGTGRYRRMSAKPRRLPSVAADTLGVAEATVALSQHGITARSILDTDILRAVEAGRGHLDPETFPHLIVCGGPRVNGVVTRLLEDAALRGWKLVGFNNPEANRLTFPNGALAFGDDPPSTAGMIAAIANPWCEGRLIVLCCGEHCEGTVAAMRLLSGMLSGRYAIGNSVDELPVRIFTGNLSSSLHQGDAKNSSLSDYTPRTLEMQTITSDVTDFDFVY